MTVWTSDNYKTENFNSMKIWTQLTTRSKIRQRYIEANAFIEQLLQIRWNCMKVNIFLRILAPSLNRPWVSVTKSTDMLLYMHTIILWPHYMHAGASISSIWPNISMHAHGNAHIRARTNSEKRKLGHAYTYYTFLNKWNGKKVTNVIRK